MYYAFGPCISTMGMRHGNGFCKIVSGNRKIGDEFYAAESEKDNSKGQKLS